MDEIRETAYDHVKGNNTFSVTAAEQWSIGMVNRLKAQFPDEVQIIATNADGSMLAHFPSDWMRIVPKRSRQMTDEQKEAFAQRMSDARMEKDNITTDEEGTLLPMIWYRPHTDIGKSGKR